MLVLRFAIVVMVILGRAVRLFILMRAYDIVMMIPTDLTGANLVVADTRGNSRFAA